MKKNSILLFSLCWLSSFTLPAAGQEPTEQTPSYKVERQDLWRTLLFTGELQAERSLVLKVPRIRSSFSNTVTYMPLEGTQVKKGERILEFDDAALLEQQEELQRRVDEAKLKIKKQAADLEAQRQDLLIDLSTQKTNLEVAELYASISEELLPQNQYQKYKVDMDRAKLALDKAKERMKNFEASYATQMDLVELEKVQAELDYQKLEHDLSMLRVDAPQDGVVIYGDNWRNNRKVQVGDNLFQRQSVMSLPDLSKMQIICYVYDTEIRFIKLGDPAQVMLDALPSSMFKGRVKSLTSIAVRKGFATEHKVFKAVVELLDADTSRMRPGMTARVEVPVLVGTEVLVVPREFLQMDTGGNYVVHKSSPGKEGTLVQQVVRPGSFNARMVEILEGLHAGDIIYEKSHVGENQ